MNICWDRSFFKHWDASSFVILFRSSVFVYFNTDILPRTSKKSTKLKALCLTAEHIIRSTVVLFTWMSYILASWIILWNLFDLSLSVFILSP
jgi:hypothetical protein